MNQKITAEMFERWVAEYRRPIFGYLLSLVRDGSLADDLTQETFFKAWKHRARYQEQGTARAYLFRIADRTLLDYRRKKKENVYDDAAWECFSDENPDPSPPPGEKLQLREEIRRLRETMGYLTEPQRRVLSLRYFSQLKFSEIAEVLELPLNTVLSHARRGLLELKGRMGEPDA
ncbi:MAG: RNA polymerase sigma factor [Planctomycetia bacterium]|nr:RNA polymerase sigma factor [Planctomycetia bacterium]